MVIQHIVIPEDDDHMKLYFGWQNENSRPMLLETGKGIELRCGADVDTLTYFNSFSYCQWRKHTGITNPRWILNMSGQAKLEVHGVHLKEEIINSIQGGEMSAEEIAGLSVQDETLAVCETENAEHSETSIEIPEHGESMIFYLRIANTGEGELTIHGGKLIADIESVRPVKIAVNICTYRREDYVKRTLKRIEKTASGEDGALYGKVEIFVSDNGKTLDRDGLTGEFAHIVYNKNAGGTGGFTRGILEALSARSEKGLSHVLFMDDDINFDAEILYRTWAFLSCCEKDITLGGSLLRGDRPEVQHEKGAFRTGDGIRAVKNGYVLSYPASLLANEVSEPVNYCGWWYCCMPLCEEMREDLPLPFFIHEDDQEYGLRRCGKIVTMNGIGVWHDPFENRRASSLQYYDVRNMLVVNAIHEPSFGWKGAFRRIVGKPLLNNLLHYRYRDIDHNIQAVEDFCRGIDFFGQTDAKELNDRLIKNGYQMEDCSQILKELGVAWGNEREKKNVFSLYRKEIPRTWKHIVTLNGWFLPDFSGRIHPLEIGCFPTMLYRKKRVLLYDPDSGRGIIVKRRYRELFHFMRAVWTVRKLLKKNYEKVAEEYRAGYRELVSEKFWRRYLAE